MMLQKLLTPFSGSENNSQYVNLGSKGQLASEALSVLIFCIFICISIYNVSASVSVLAFASASASTCVFVFVSVFIII